VFSDVVRVAADLLEEIGEVAVPLHFAISSTASSIHIRGPIGFPMEAMSSTIDRVAEVVGQTPSMYLLDQRVYCEGVGEFRGIRVTFTFIELTIPEDVDRKRIARRVTNKQMVEALRGAQPWIEQLDPKWISALSISDFRWEHRLSVWPKSESDVDRILRGLPFGTEGDPPMAYSVLLPNGHTCYVELI
jgi:hypothetical protein